MQQGKMPKQKRPYRPKTKGCFECSKRRVSCDRTVPNCMKCCSRGLNCSGFGTRIRFAEGVNTRGKFAGESIESLFEKRKGREQKKSKPAERRGTTPQDEPAQNRPSTVCPTSHDLDSFLLDGLNLDALSADVATCFRSRSDAYDDNELSMGREDLKVPEEETTSSTLSLMSLSGLHPEFNPRNQLLIAPACEGSPPWKMDLLSHFSKHIASEMIAIDGSHNGWRYIVLPMAHADDLVMDAVLAVSAFHRDAMLANDDNEYLLRNTDATDEFNTKPSIGSDGQPTSQALYDTAIEGLRKRSDLQGRSHDEVQAISIAVLVLLVAAMVTGTNDYLTILGMLQSATSAFGGEHQLETSEPGSFMVRQVRKMRVYAAPYISEFAGWNMLTSESQWDQYFDCVRYCSQSGPESAPVVAAITDIMQQAHDIYLHGVTEAPREPQSEMIQGMPLVGTEADLRIERFKETLEKLPDAEPGAHVLVWAIFMVAAASSLESHRLCFRAALLKHYSRSRFSNLLRGILQLPQIWKKRDQGAKWTQLLPEAGLFLM